MIGALGGIFLAVSLVSLLTQAAALGRLRSWPRGSHGPRDTEVFRGLLRTSACRVIAAVLYVATGTITLIAADTLPVLALSVFTAVQILWQGNALADLRLRHRLSTTAGRSAMSIGKWGDAIGHPPGTALRAAGYTGMWAYVGTPGNRKNLTAAVYRDWAAAGLAVGAIFEVDTTDFVGGHAAGVAHAQAALADAAAIGLPRTAPIGPTIDEHLSAGLIPTAVAYQTGFHATVRAAGWTGPVAAYGFAEFTTAAAAARVADVLWQCGSRASVGTRVAFWQDNTGSDVVAGVQVDRDWQLLPLPTTLFGGVTDMELTDSLAPYGGVDTSGKPVPAGAALADVYVAISNGKGHVPGDRTLFQRFDAVDAALAALSGALTDGQAALLAAVRGVQAGTVDVPALAQALVPLLSTADAHALLTELHAVLPTAP